MIADIRIRQQTNNVFGLQDALAAIVHAHGSIEDEWPIEQVLAVADKRTGTTVLEDLYNSWRATPVKVDLTELWNQLGIRDSQEGVFDDSAPLASVRDTLLSSPSTNQLPEVDRPEHPNILKHGPLPLRSRLAELLPRPLRRLVRTKLRRSSTNNVPLK
jgi:hypothetical protein